MITFGAPPTTMLLPVTFLQLTIFTCLLLLVTIVPTVPAAAVVDEVEADVVGDADETDWDAIVAAAGTDVDDDADER